MRGEAGGEAHLSTVVGVDGALVLAPVALCTLTMPSFAPSRSKRYWFEYRKMGAMGASVPLPAWQP